MKRILNHTMPPFNPCDHDDQSVSSLQSSRDSFTKHVVRFQATSFLLDDDDGHHHNSHEQNGLDYSSLVTSGRGLSQVTFNLDSVQWYDSTELSEEEVRASWYSREELDFIQQKDAFLVESYQSGMCPLDSDRYCLRGLEYKDFTPAYYAVSAVLKEQAGQRKRGIDRPDFIANVYILSSHYAKKEAIMMGQMDAAEAFGGHVFLEKRGDYKD